MKIKDDKCPVCGGELENDEADVGVGIIYGPARCPSCYWVEGDAVDPIRVEEIRRKRAESSQRLPR